MEMNLAAYRLCATFEEIATMVFGSTVSITTYIGLTIQIWVIDSMWQERKLFGQYNIWLWGKFRFSQPN